MQGMFNRKRPAAGAVGHLKKLVAESLKLSEDTILSVAELTCHEPGCPPVETVITARKTDGEQKNWRIAKPISEIKEADINKMIVEF